MQRVKLKGYYIYKFSSARLKQDGFNIQTDFDLAVRNGELIRLLENQLLELATRFFYFERKNSNTVFTESIVEVQFDNGAHYRKIVKDGLWINGKKYVRIMAGAANIRKNTVYFVVEKIQAQLLEIMNNGRKRDVKLNPSKFNAYMGLYGSSGWPVTFPKFVVVPDCNFERGADVNWVDSNSHKITSKSTKVKLNLFDGQGLVSPNLAKQWASEIGLDYIPSTFIVRAPFLKGLLATFDFHSFSTKIAGNHEITDVWGNVHDVRDVEVIISESQFKLWQSYQSADEYLSNCLKNKLGFRISRYSKRQPGNVIRSNYMFLQVLNMGKEDVETLCTPTVEFFEKMVLDRKAMLTFSLPNVNKDISYLQSKDLEKEALALLFDEEFENEPHIQTYFLRQLQKKAKEAKLGSVYLHGNYQPAISDPFAQCEHIFGMPVLGLLFGEHDGYSKFWADLGVQKVASGRSPLTHYSEMFYTDIQDNNETREWFRYLEDGFVIASQSLATMFYADSDFDGDLLFSTDNEQFLNCRIGGSPITYDKKSAKKVIIDEQDLWRYDLLGFNTKIGYITNVSSYFHSLIYNYKPGSPERIELENRLMICRLLQGESIDAAKNDTENQLQIPKYWTKIEQDVIGEDLNRSLLAKKRPAFMRHLYSDYGYKYKKFMESREFWASQFGLTWQEMIEKENKSEEEIRGIDQFERLNPFLENNSPMSMVERFVSEKIKEKFKTSGKKFNWRKFILNENASFLWVEEFWKLYKEMKKQSRQDGSHNYQPIFDTIRKQMLSRHSNLDYILDGIILFLYAYKETKETSFLWDVFGKELLERVSRMNYSRGFVPMKDRHGSFEMLWNKYNFVEMEVR